MPNGVLIHQLHRRLYRDSVSLMSMASELERQPGVIKAGAVMATPANIDILERSQMLPDGLDCEPDDLIVVVRAEQAEHAEAALTHAHESLSAKVSVSGGDSLEVVPVTIAEAVEAGVTPDLVTISVPGTYAASVAMDALHHGAHVFCFSDNVSLAEENMLKTYAHDHGLLVMGPDCGTAIISGTPLGFANQVLPGSVGIIAASGTGAQEVSSLITRAGIGISQLIGVGGRDLGGAIDHPTTLQALDMLEADEATDLIVIVSKPAHPDVADKLLTRLGTSPKPVIACLLGLEDADEPLTIRGTLEGAALAIAHARGVDLDLTSPRVEGPAPSRLLGLYTGGTLAHEAHIITERAGVEGTILDLGDDEYTQGRPHPMISPDLRAEMIAAIDEPTLLLVDVVIGAGSSSDPATPVVKAVKSAREHLGSADDLLVLACVTGTDGDPQGLDTQRAILRDGGIHVFASHAAAVREAVRLMKGE